MPVDTHNYDTDYNISFKEKRLLNLMQTTICVNNVQVGKLAALHKDNKLIINVFKIDEYQRLLGYSKVLLTRFMHIANTEYANSDIIATCKCKTMPIHKLQRMFTKFGFAVNYISDNEVHLTLNR